jgi:hypothetical protein
MYDRVLPYLIEFRALPYLIEFNVILWLVSVPLWLLLGCYANWKTYTAYKMLGDRVVKQGFMWFSFQFQLPSFSRGTPIYVEYFESLPPDLKARHCLLRRQMLRSIWTMAIWFASLVTISALLAWVSRRMG